MINYSGVKPQEKRDNRNNSPVAKLPLYKQLKETSVGFALVLFLKFLKLLLF